MSHVTNTVICGCNAWELDRIFFRVIVVFVVIDDNVVIVVVDMDQVVVVLVDQLEW